MSLSYSDMKSKIEKTKIMTTKEIVQKKPIGRSAKDIYKVVQRVRQKNEKRAIEAFREKCTNAVTTMLKSGDLVTEIELEEDDYNGINNVIHEMRGLGYRHCLIETENEEGEVLSHRLRISLAHLES